MSREITPQDLDAIRARVGLAATIGRYVTLRKRGREHVGLCPFHTERTPSFTVNEGKGFYHCFGCGAHGDVIGFTMAIDGLTFPEAVRRLTQDGGLDDPAQRERLAARERERRAAAERRSVRERTEKVSKAIRIWRRTQPASGTLVERYIEARGVPIGDLAGSWGTGIPPSLRFDPACPYWYWSEAGREWRQVGVYPAMVAGVQDSGGRLVAVHVTYLAPDGTRKLDLPDPEVAGERLAEKKMHGPVWGGAVRFARMGGKLTLAEGIETGLSVVAARNRAGYAALPVWAALSLGNIAGAGHGRGRRHPHHEGPHATNRRLPSPWPDLTRPGIVLPPEIREIVICTEGDSKDPLGYDALLKRATRRYIGEGRTVRHARPAPGQDFNDMMQPASAGSDNAAGAE